MSILRYMPNKKRSRWIIGTGVAAVAVAGAVIGVHRAGLQREDPEQHWALLEQYCMDCHNSVERAGDLVLQGFTPHSMAEHAEVFEEVARRLRGRLMPPPGGPRPEEERLEAFLSWLENDLDRNPLTPRTGHVPIQRLDRTEYAVAVRGLLGVEIDPRQYLPTEQEVDGFTNVAAALSVSPAFLEQYVGAARAVARLAVGEAVPRVSSTYHPPPADAAQDDYVAGLPPGTRGGTSFRHNFPADGEYRITLADLDVGLYPRSLETEQTVVMLIDREEVFRQTMGGPEDLALVDREGATGRAKVMERFTDIPVNVKAGVREVVVTFIERSRAATDELTYGFQPYGGFSYEGEVRGPRLIGGVEVVGPFNSPGISSTASRDRIFICRPESAANERACAERITRHLAQRAFRRPVDQDDIDRLMAFYEVGHDGVGGFDAGIEHMVAAVLASPDFLYRTVLPSEDIGEERFYALDDLELASRLSFFLWSQGPDDELLELATAGKLRDADVLEAQARRMLADPRAETLVTNFALRWLHLNDLEAVVPDDRLFPTFSDDLREDFATELDLFLRSILLEDRNVQELLTADHTFLNERLARHYDIDGVHGPQFRRVALEDANRHGLLGKGAVLLRTSYGDRTSPVIRGAWVLEKLIGTPPAPPPPDVETDLTTPEGEEPTTIRARLEQHRDDPSCHGCHAVIDPYGMALENFDAIGRWRVYDDTADAPIDASEVLPDGVAVDGVVELREALMRRPEQLVRAMTEKLMMYAIGRKLDYHDMPQVRAVVRAAARDDYRVSAIVAGIVQSDAFRMQALPREGGDADDGQLTARAVAGARTDRE